MPFAGLWSCKRPAEWSTQPWPTYLIARRAGVFQGLATSVAVR